MNTNFRKISNLLRLSAVGTAVGGLALTSATSAFAAPFTPGNLVVYRIGAGTGSLTNAGTAVFLDEFSSTATGQTTPVNTIALPTAPSGTNNRLVASGTATSEGLLTRSVDGRYLFATGYGTALGTANVATTAGARVVGRVDAAGIVDTSTALTNFSPTNNIRSAASTDGNAIWVTGGNGVGYTTLGSTTATILATATTRQVNIFPRVNSAATDPQLYVPVSTAVNALGNGLPTTGTPTSTSVVTGLTSAYPFVLLDLSATIPGADTLYVADDAGTIRKFSFTGSAFVANGTLALANARGLTATASGNTVTLFATAASTSASSLVRIVDTSGYNATITGTPTTLATAGAYTLFRGVAFAPANAVAATDGALISEFRTSGPGGGANEYVELINTTSSSLDISGWTVRYPVGGTTTSTTISTGTTIPAFGHYLLTGSGYDLTDYATSNQALNGDIDQDALVSLFNAAGTQVDDTSSASSTTTAQTGQYAWVRPNFSPTFTLVAVDAAGGAQLGAPGPENLGSPRAARVGELTYELADPGAGANTAPNRVRDTSAAAVAAVASATGVSSNTGTMLFRQAVRNLSTRTIIGFRVRLANITTLNSPGYTSNPGQADLRLLSSSDETVTLSTGTQTVYGTTLQAPAQAQGGGLNSSASAATVTLNTPLAPNATSYFSFLYGVARGGRYSTTFIFEPVYAP